MRLTDKEFDQKSKAVYTTTGEGTNLADWKIPSDQRDLLTTPKGEWEAAFDTGGKDNKLHRSELETQTKDIKRGIYEPILNTFVAGWIKSNNLIPDEKKLDMHVHVDSGSYHHNTVPTTFPVDTKVDTSTPLKVKIELKDSETGKGAKPAGVLRIQTWVFISEAKIVNDAITYTQPASNDDYIHFGDDSSDMRTETTFKSADAGKTVYIIQKYANNVGSGGFGRPVITVIPK